MSGGDAFRSANRELRQHVLRISYNPIGAASGGGTCRVERRIAVGTKRGGQHVPAAACRQSIDRRLRLPLAAADLLRREAVLRALPVVRHGARGVGVAIPVTPAG